MGCLHKEFFPHQASLELMTPPNGEAVDHATAFGRIAFSIPTSELEALQKSVEDAEGKILTRLVTLDTPGKASVSVVILADPVNFSPRFENLRIE